MKLKVAVTGSIGSGKSSFCELLSHKGFPVISADEESKLILANNKKVKSEIIKTFGSESYINGEVNKKYLAEKIFPDQQNVLKINSILHPHVIEKVNLLLNENLKTSNIVFVEAALIYEADMEFLFDYIVLISADKQTRLLRKIKMNMSEKDFLKRNSNQIPDEEKMKRADFVFINNGSLEDLEQKANLLIITLKGLSNTNG